MAKQTPEQKEIAALVKQVSTLGKKIENIVSIVTDLNDIVVKLENKESRGEVVKQKKPMKPNPDFDIETITARSNERIEKMIADKRRDPKNHFQGKYEHDVKKSYAASLKFCTTEEQRDHVESVLSVPGRYDR
jgi:hypothetical protein